MSKSTNGATQRTAVYVSGISFRGMPVPFGSRKRPLFASSGIPGSEPETKVLPEDGALQVKFLFANIKRGIEAAGGSLEDIIIAPSTFAMKRFVSISMEAGKRHFRTRPAVRRATR